MLSRLRRLLGRENGERPETREGQNEASLQSPSNTRSKRWFWYRQRTAGEPLTHQTLLPREQLKKEMEKLTRELQLVTNQRNELRDRLLFISEGTVDNRSYHEPNRFYEKLKVDYKQVMSDLKMFENENIELSKKYSELRKETVFYHGLQSRLLMEHNQLSKKVDILRMETKQHLDEWDLRKDLNVVSKDKEEETHDLRTQQQQELKSLEERLQFLLKQKGMNKEKHLSEKLQHHFEGPQMRSKNCHPKLEQATVQDESHLEKEALQ